MRETLNNLVIKLGCSLHFQVPKYRYSYTVKDDYTRTNFGHRESRDGYQTRGTYFVVLPDYRLQVVEYVADENGYVARVSYRGQDHSAAADLGTQSSSASQEIGTGVGVGPQPLYATPLGSSES